MSSSTPVDFIYDHDAFYNSWYPFPLDSANSAYVISPSSCGLMFMRCIPVIGNIVSAIQRHNDPKTIIDSKTKTKLSIEKQEKNKFEYAKCERMGAFLLMLTGIALLALFPNVGRGNIAFAIAGGALLGVGTIEALYFSRKVIKLRASWDGLL